MHLNRYQASLTHLIISGTVIGCFFSVVFFIWYPNPYFSIEDTLNIMVILFTVDVVLGPLLTFVVFKSGKPGLKSDLSIIAAIQIFALFYGGGIIYNERPLFIAFDVNQFLLARASEINSKELSEIDTQINRPLSGPSYVYAETPSQLSISQKLLYKAYLRPKQYSDLNTHFNDTFDHSLDLDTLANHSPENKSLIDKFRSRHPNISMESLAFYPLLGKIRHIVLVMTRDNLKLIDYIDINSTKVPENKVSDQKTKPKQDETSIISN